MPDEGAAVREAEGGRDARRTRRARGSSAADKSCRAADERRREASSGREPSGSGHLVVVECQREVVRVVVKVLTGGSKGRSLIWLCCGPQSLSARTSRSSVRKEPLIFEGIRGE